MTKTQNFITEGYFQAKTNHRDLEKILSDISQKSGFKPNKLINKSEWWDSGRIGAAHYSGKINSEEAVLKIQLIKPNISEIEMIINFEKNNQSQIIRPPKLFFSIPWNDENQYEALIIEDVGRKKVISPPGKLPEVDKFFELYQEYKENCLTKPWLERPDYPISESTQQRFDKWKKISAEIYPDHPLKTQKSLDLVDRAIKLLVEKYQEMEWEFQHGHFSPDDLYKKNGQYILLSNLYWSWRAPYYDAVFGYQWHIYHFANSPGISEPEIKKHSDYWLEKIWALVENKDKKEKQLLQLALLERAAAGLNLDVYTVKSKNAKYAIELTANNIKSFLDEIA